MRVFGLVAGDLWSAVTGKPRAPQKKVLRRDVEERTTDTPDGKVILRRTTIEEVEIKQPPPAP